MSRVRTFFEQYIPFYKRNLKVALPIMFTQLGATLVGFFDTMMVGHFGTVDLAAVSLSNAIFFMVMVFAMGAIIGITPLIGFEVGKGKKEGVEDTRQIASYLLNGLIYTAILSVVMVVLMVIVGMFFDKMGQDPQVIQTAGPYYTLIVISIVPFLFFFLLKQFLEGLGNTMVAMIISFGMNGLNILLNWVLIYGHWGFEPMGATGAGWATLISRSLMPFCFLAAILLRKEWRCYITLFSCKLCQLKEIIKLHKVGFPIGGQTFLETFLFTFAFILIGWINKESLAAHQIANQVVDINFMLAMGVGSATTIRVSHQLGAGDLYAVRMASNASIHLCLVINTISAIFMITCRNIIPLWFTKDPEVVSIASSLILIGGFLQYADGLQAVGVGMLRGITDVKISMIGALICYIVVALPLCYLLTFNLNLGAQGMWIGFIVGLSLAAIFFHIRFRIKYKKMLNQNIN